MAFTLIDLTYKVNKDGTSNLNLFNILLLSTAVTMSTWLMYIYWSRKKLYIYSRKVPGPPTLPIIGNALELRGKSTDIHKVLTRWFESYRPFARVWLVHRLYYLISKPEHLEVILNSPHALDSDDMYRLLNGLIGEAMFRATGKRWKKLRKLLTPAFNQKILNQYVEIFVEHAQQLQSDLEKQVGNGIFDIEKYISTFTTGSVCETFMDIKVGSHAGFLFLTWVERDEVGKAIKTTKNRKATDPDKIPTQMLKILGGKTINLLVKIFNKICDRGDISSDRLRSTFIPIPKTAKIISQKKLDHDEKLEELTNEFMDEDTCTHKSFIDFLMKLCREGLLNEDDVKGEVNTFIPAGSDTTSCVLKFTCVALGMYPDIQQKVYEEVTEILGHDRNPTHEDLTKFKYLERVIKETMRIFTPVPFILRKVRADIDLGDFILPAGSSVVMGIFQTHRDATYWENPLKFNPDRFLSDEMAKNHSYSYIPFGGGPRNCIGFRYGMMIMKTVLAMLVRKFIFKCDYKNAEEIKLTSKFVLSPIDGFKVSITSRE